MDKGLRLQFLKTTTALITAAFGMVAALAWNEAIRKLIGNFLSSGNGELMALVVYAVAVTVIAVLATVYIARLYAKAEEAAADEQETWEKKKEAWRAEWEEERKKAELRLQWDNEAN